MGEPSTFVGMDVHRQDIAVAMLVPGTAGPIEWRVANEPTSVRRLARRLERAGGHQLHCVYEAGPCGYALQRQLQGQGLACDVVAPSMIPIRPGERIKTDRRDARKLAELARAGILTVVHPPSEDEEAVRDLCRGRDDARLDLMRARHRLGKFLLRRGRVFGTGEQRGGITHTGNRHVRRLLIEAAWHYRHKPRVGAALAERRHGQPASVIALADKAQLRLCRRYRRMEHRGKHPTKIVVAVAREMVGYLWAALTPTASGAQLTT